MWTFIRMFWPSLLLLMFVGFKSILSDFSLKYYLLKYFLLKYYWFSSLFLINIYLELIFSSFFFTFTCPQLKLYGLQYRAGFYFCFISSRKFHLIDELHSLLYVVIIDMIELAYSHPLNFYLTQLFFQMCFAVFMLQILLTAR